MNMLCLTIISLISQVFASQVSQSSSPSHSHSHPHSHSRSHPHRPHSKVRLIPDVFTPNMSLLVASPFNLNQLGFILTQTRIQRAVVGGWNYAGQHMVVHDTQAVVPIEPATKPTVSLYTKPNTNSIYVVFEETPTSPRRTFRVSYRKYHPRRRHHHYPRYHSLADPSTVTESDSTSVSFSCETTN